MKRLLLAVIALQIYAIQNGFADNTSDSLYFEKKYQGMTEEQIAAYEDSVLKANYPAVRIETRPDAEQKETAGQSLRTLSPGFDPIQNTYVPYSADIDTSLGVEEIEIHSEALPSGAKAYTVPIKAYAVEGGFSPQLSLNYNSLSGNGILGRGWSIGGLSAITRGNKSVYFDSMAEGMKMNTSDAFYLDGLRLIRISSASGNYTYETEQGNIKVVGYYSGNVMKYFKVYYPNGNRAVFGYETNSTNLPVYPVTSMSDLRGRTISYTYTNTNPAGIYHISQIQYNGTKILFNYSSSRPDPIRYYCYGNSYSENRLLTSIVCLFEGMLSKLYSLTYETKYDVSTLKQIGCSFGAMSLNPLVFYYGDYTTLPTYETPATTQATIFYTDPRLCVIKSGRFSYFNHRGGLIAYPNKNCYYKYHRYLNDYFIDQYAATDSILAYPTNESNIIFSVPIQTGEGFVDILCADLYGNQEDCIVKVNNSVVNDKDQVKFTVYRGNGTTGLSTAMTRTYNFNTVYTDLYNHKSIQPKYYYAGDFNGDGKMEILAVSVANPFGESNRPSKCYLFDLINNTLLYEGSLFTFNQQFCGSIYDTEGDFPDPQERVFVMDYDGDGKTDICHVNSSGLKTYSFNSSGSYGSLSGSYSGLTKSTLHNRQFMLAELNGDGMTDLLVSPVNEDYSDTAWKAYESMGNGQFNYYTMTGPLNLYAPRFFVQDVNNDGITDLIKLEENFCGTSLVGNQTISTGWNVNASSSSVAPVDINSHSRFLKLATISNTGVISWYSFQRNMQKDLMLTGMVSSKGVIEKNAYELILHDSDFSMGQFYSAGSDASFPYVNISEPIAAYAGSDIYYKSTLKDCFRYQYENAVIHRQGLGFRGFGKITAINSRGQRTVSTYNPYSFSTLASVASPTGESSFDYTCSVQWNKIRKVNMTHSVKEDLLTGFIEESTCQYDAYGYPTNLSKTYSDGISETSVIDYTSNTAVGNGYCLGIPNSRVRTVTQNNDTYTERIYSSSFNSAMQPLDRFLSVNGVDIRSHTFAYDGNGNMTAETVQKYADSNTQTSAYTYDTYGRLLQKTDPAGLTTQYTYNNRGKVAAIVDCLGNTTSFAYNNLDQPTTTTYPDGTTKTVTREWTSDYYDSLWKITQTAIGKPETSVSVDAFGRETLSSQQLVDKTVFTVSKYDDYGNLTHKSMPFSTNGYPYYTVNTFDVYNRITSTTEYGGGQTTYSYSGNTVTVTNDSRSVSKTYNSQGEVTSVTDPAGTITYELAADGQPISITAPGNAVTTFAYDQTRRRTSLTDPSFGTTTYTYDCRGNMATETDADGNTCSYTYDSLDRIVEKETPELTVAYTYNSLGQLTSAVGDNSTARRFTYDTYGRISSEKYEAPDSKWLQKAYTYSNGNVSSTAYTSQSGTLATENYTYSNGHLLETTANGSSIGYCDSVNNFGHPLQITRGSLTDSYAYTYKGLLSEHTAAWNSNNIQKYFYTFSPQTGNLTSRHDFIMGGLENFTYDSLDRLTAYGGETVEYDVKGNILSKSDVGTFSYNSSSKPYAVTDISQTASAIPSVSQNITYNYFRQPLSITEGTHAASFIYDGEDSRVKMQVTQSGSNKLTRYYLGGCYETDVTPSGTTERLYLGGDYYTAPAVLVKTSTGTSLYYIVRDHLGSITHVLNTSGTDLQHLSYDAWGRLRNPSNKQVYSAANTPTLLLGRGYTGHEHLTDFGLINMNGRLYDPVLGRFLSPDNYVQSPFFSQNFNRYSYCLNNPLRYNDKDGDWILELVLAIVGAYIGGVASNSGELNPGHWNYKAATTWLGMGVGAIVGYAGGYGILNPGTISFGASISTPWVSVGGLATSSTAALGGGTDWKFNFHWTTAAGDGGTTEYSPSKLDEQVGQIFDDAVADMRSYYNRYSSDIHTGLDAAGVFLDLADGANALLYSLEGDYTNAGISALAMAPVVGSLATGGKFVNKGYATYNKFLSRYGKAGDGMEWHHIVERRMEGKFGAERIHHIDNMIRLPKDVHRKISARYSSKMPGKNMTVREWLNGKSYEEQYEFGRKLLKEYGY